MHQLTPPMHRLTPPMHRLTPPMHQLTPPMHQLTPLTADGDVREQPVEGVEGTPAVLAGEAGRVVRGAAQAGG